MFPSTANRQLTVRRVRVRSSVAVGIEVSSRQLQSLDGRDNIGWALKMVSIAQERPCKAEL